jgi:hypothetical protein
MIWTVKIMRRALKQVDRLPVNVRENLTLSETWSFMGCKGKLAEL